MLSAEENRRLTEVGAGKPMGELLRRYWHPIAGVSELDAQPVRPIRLLGENLVLYKDLAGTLGLIGRHCPHRRADLSFGIPEDCGLRCVYHGWQFDQNGACIQQPFDDKAHPELRLREKVRLQAYPIETRAGLVWTYMGPEPRPLLPDWEPFSWPNGFTQIVISEIPCNWFQGQENSIDPVHFEWMHENWGQRLRNQPGPYGPTHLKLKFEEFEYGFVYKRVKENTDEQNENWTIGRVCLWPNAFFLGEHFEWRVPIDDENTLSITWKYTRVPSDREPYVQKGIPAWRGPIHDEQGRWITSHVMNQDFLAWVGQGRIADRTKEHLGMSDRGINMIRRRFFREMESIAAGQEAKGIIRDPARNVRVVLPLMARADIARGFTRAEIVADEWKRMVFGSYVFQAGQPDEVKRQYDEAMGFEAPDAPGRPGSISPR